MPAPADSQIVMRAGTAEPSAMTLLPGQPVGPFSFGRRGTWRIVGPGVLEEHGFLYFNGTDLFLQSTDPQSPVLAGGSPIPTDWTAIHAPCEIAVGGARLFFGSPEVHAPPASGPPRFAPRVQGNDDEIETRLAPIEELAAMRGIRAPPAARPPSFGPAPFASGPQAGTGPVTSDPMVFPGSGAPPGAPSPPAQSWIGARWRETSGPKKALVVLMAPLVWAVWVIFTDPPPPAPSRPAASASSQPSASAAAPPASAPIAPAVSAPAPSAASSARGAAGAASSSPATTGAKTPPREAADAVAAGAYDRAATLYEELARAHPEVPAYAEAARIMKAKAGKR